jgi:3-methyladenine DNA glycosylase AlkC
MSSNSSQTNIQQRTINNCQIERLIDKIQDYPLIFTFLNTLLTNEYDNIPEKERIGKGGLFIARAIAGGVSKYLTTETRSESIDYLSFCESAFEFGFQNAFNLLQYFAICFLTKWIEKNPKNLEKSVPFLEKLADNEDWVIRETVVDPIANTLAKFPDNIFSILEGWALSSNENLRRIAIEGLRPKATVKWLRNPEANNKVFHLLGVLRNDSSEYVRKSVGNNLKDLSKYMPEKVLESATTWIKNAHIDVNENLSSKSKSELGESDFYLVWTLKQALRWIKDRNPEYHSQLETILGKNYVLYFDEKKNWKALPK